MFDEIFFLGEYRWIGETSLSPLELNMSLETGSKKINIKYMRKYQIMISTMVKIKNGDVIDDSKGAT